MTEAEIIGCEQALRLLAAYLDGELEAADQSDMERHLERCRACYSRAEFERRLAQHVAALRSAPVTADFEQRIRTLLDRFGDPA